MRISLDLRELASLAGVLTLAACATAPAEPDVAATNDEPVVVATVAWPEVRSCPALVEAILAMHKQGRTPSSSNAAPLAILIDPLHNASIKRDLPVPVYSTTDETASRCIMQIGGPIDGIDLERRVLRDARLYSSYPSNTRTVRNPEYDRLQRQARSLSEDDGDGFGMFATGDPMLDLVGLVASGIFNGIAALTSSRDGVDFEATLDNTPRTIEVPVLSPYSYDLTELEATRRTRVTVSLIDRQTDQYWVSEIKLWERKRFALSDDRHPGDPTRQHDPQATLVTSSELDQWQNSTPPLALSRALNSVLDPREPIKLADLGSDDGPGGMPATASKPSIVVPDGIVRVGDRGEGRGFYVDREHILTLARYTRGSSLTKVTLADGGSVYGMVARQDPTGKLVLVYMPKSGSELPLLTGKAIPEPEQIPLGLTPGTPIGDGTGVVALIIAIDEQGLAKTMSALEIQQFLAQVK